MIGCGTRDKMFPVAKISDTPEKSISGSVKYLEYLKDLYGIEVRMGKKKRKKKN